MTSVDYKMYPDFRDIKILIKQGYFKSHLEQFSHYGTLFNQLAETFTGHSKA